MVEGAERIGEAAGTTVFKGGGGRKQGDKRVSMIAGTPFVTLLWPFTFLLAKHPCLSPGDFRPAPVECNG